jgi:hypothetical protein
VLILGFGICGISALKSRGSARKLERLLGSMPDALGDPQRRRKDLSAAMRTPAGCLVYTNGELQGEHASPCPGTSPATQRQYYAGFFLERVGSFGKHLGALRVAKGRP